MSLYEERFKKLTPTDRNEVLTLDEMDELRDRLIIKLRNEKPHVLAGIREYRAEVTATIREVVEKARPRASREEARRILEDIIDDIYGWGPISDLMRDPHVTDIWIFRWNHIRYERLGVKNDWPRTFKGEAHLRRWAERMAASRGRKVDEGNPVEECRLPDGSRVVIMLNAVCDGGTTVMIRRFGAFLTLEDLTDLGMFDQSAISICRDMVARRMNILMTGGFGSGKNTVMNAFLAIVPHDQSTAIFEDPIESQLMHAILHGPKELREKLPRDVWLLEPRHSNVEGAGEVSLDRLYRSVLKMKPNRIIVGEVVDWKTAYYALSAMNLNQPGSMTTVNARDIGGALRKMDTFLISYPGGAFASPEARAAMIAGIDRVMLFEQDATGLRYLKEIAEVVQPGRGVFPEARTIWHRGDAS